ncbi:MAG: hypothetical protein ABIZ57_05960 [Candidatus Limnocylindria bacterium]
MAAGCLSSQVETSQSPVEPTTLADVETDAALARAMGAVVQGESGSTSLAGLQLPTGARGLAYVALRIDGVLAEDAWAEGTSSADALSTALIASRDGLDADEGQRVDSIEVAIAGPEREPGLDGSTIANNLDRGTLGMNVSLSNGETARYAPSRMIAENTSFDRVIERLQESGDIPADGLATDDIELFEATQLLVDLDAETVTRVVRGNELIPASAVTEETTRVLATGMADWLTRQLDDDGRMVYAYFPSRGEESQSNNMIRQWMATVALQRIAEDRDDDTLRRRARDNTIFNLDLSYRREDGLGLIADPDGDVKLGAVALAALALSQSSDRASFAEEEAALRRTVDHLWSPDGSFDTFYVPAGRRDNQNFYPGEALLLWAVTLEREFDPDLLDRFMTSFAYYRAWHREQPNPAFVPWHTMAYAKVWAITKDPALRDFVFEMNDWLLDLQQWEDAPAPDAAGRFYNPDRPDFGPPHASSDGVYLEGLIAAHRLTVAVDDDVRGEIYRTAIARGIRHLMQLQFADAVDMYYVSRRDRVAGGMRTTVYDNAIRVDNVQHGLLAVMDVLESFGPADYRIEGPSP